MVVTQILPNFCMRQDGSSPNIRAGLHYTASIQNITSRAPDLIAFQRPLPVEAISRGLAELCL